jgi:hypothetical protein
MAEARMQVPTARQEERQRELVKDPRTVRPRTNHLQRPTISTVSRPHVKVVSTRLLWTC